MTLNHARRRGSLPLRPAPAHQRWSIPADSRQLWRESAYMVRSRSCLSPTEPYGGSWSSESSDSALSIDSSNSLYRVVLIGEAGVGKSTLTSLFAGFQPNLENCDTPGEDTYERTITVDGEGTTLIVMDTWENKDEDSWVQDHCMQIGDAYLIVYSITDRASFEKASELRIQLRRIRQAEDIPIILVGNKCDLVRCREVSVAEGRSCAVVFDCKFIETSAAVQHNVQELFEGIVRQVRLRKDSKEVNDRRMAQYKRRESFPRRARRFLDRLVAKNNKKMAYKVRSKSCHDLSVL
ncbi:GTP-binding protein GEM [Hemitrygon akajei]|uniref:GTP-binding protein GEM n=1 Tax=Hemitrygon akajei TaxID=2704970 RepID=UPI003BF98A0C